MTLKNVNFKVSAASWAEFRQLCVQNDTNASAEIRNFIKQYIRTYGVQKIEPIHIDRN